jgi:hypothetical protein
MTVRSSANAQVIYRSVRGMAWINAIGCGVFLALAAACAWRGKKGGAYVAVFMGGVWLLKAAISVWRMRRARDRAQPVELFSGRGLNPKV